MPMIDVYAAAGTFPDSHALAQDLAAAVMRWEQVPDLPLFANNTAAFIHNIDEAAISNVAGESNYVRVQVLTPVGVLDRDKQLGVVEELTEIVAAAARDPSLRERTWVLLTESPEGGWGIAGHANTNAGIAATAPPRSQVSRNVMRGVAADRRARTLAADGA
jgi:phenylpyruvate tautomerase PptA (4-oxalocrotonate tautomerase family)